MQFANSSGPLLDRLDIHIEVPPVPFRELSNEASAGTNSETMKAQVIAARKIQERRFGKGSLRLNGRMTPSQFRQFCKLEADAEELHKNAKKDMGLSARAHGKILRIGRTIADLKSTEQISAAHLSEAINYRTLDRSFWK